MKKWFTFLASVTALGLSSWAIASTALSSDPKAPKSRQERIEQLRKSPRKAPQGPSRAPVMSGDKQLYGITYEGDVYGVDNRGNHSSVASTTNNVMSTCYANGIVLTMSFGDKSDPVTYNIYGGETYALRRTFSYTNNSPNVRAFDLSYDPTTNRVYGCFTSDQTNASTNNASQGMLSYFSADDFTEATIFMPTEVGEMNMRMRGMAFDGNGVLYGLGRDGKLYTVDKHTAALTEVVTVTMPVVYGTDYEEYEDFSVPGLKGSESMEIDWATGDIYMSMNSYYGSPAVVKIDKTTGATTMVYNGGMMTAGGDDSFTYFNGIFFKQQRETSASTPKAPTDMTVAPDGISLSATVSFTMPAKDTENNDLSGDQTWNVKHGDNVLATGTAAPGADVSTKVSVDAAGSYDLLVTAGSGNAESLPVSAVMWIGPDTPEISSDVNAVISEGTVFVAWRPAEGLNGGNVGDLTYKVVRQPANVTIAESATATTVTDDYSPVNKEQIYYEVIPTAAGLTGAAKPSRKIFIGRVFALPHHNDFTTADVFNEYPVIDANNDGNTWWCNTAPNRLCATYSSNGSTANDYLCVGPFEMKAGTTYIFDAIADNHSDPENIALYIGTDPGDVNTFATELVKPTLVVTSYNGTRIHSPYMAETDGDYYFALKACSAGGRELYVKTVDVTEVSNATPAAPTDLVIKGLKNGVEVRCTLPAKTIGGQSTTLNGVNIYRDGELLTTVTENVAAGAEFSYVVTESASAGSHVYNVSCSNAEGEGLSATAEGWSGSDIPGRPENIRVWEDLNDPTLIHVTWDAPATGPSGGYVDADGLNWTVNFSDMGSIDYVVSTGNKTTCDFNLQASDVEKQNLLGATISATNAVGSGRSRTRSCYIGPAVSLPLYEPFANGRRRSGIWSSEAIIDTDDWDALWDSFEMSSTGVASQDEDSYVYGLVEYNLNIPYRGRSPRFTIAGAENPVLVFYYYYTTDVTRFDLEIMVDDQPAKVLRSFDLDRANSGDWIRVEIPLSEYKNSKYLQLGFVGSSNMINKVTLMIDNLTITDMVDFDLAMMELTVPAKVVPNAESEIYATIRNFGAKEVKGSEYTIVLSRNGQDVVTADGYNIKPGQIALLDLPDVPSVADPENNEYVARIVFANDQNLANNASAASSSFVSQPTLPVPTGLSARGENGVYMAWTAPDPADNPAIPVTEDFESYAPFIIDNIGDWKVVDLDEAVTVVPATFMGPCTYDNVGKPMAWQVMNPDLGMIWTWHAPSGAQHLCSMQACVAGTRQKESNDWLISPRLNGMSQRISFRAVAGASNQVPELMDIYYSTTGTEIDDFIPLKENIEVGVGEEWPVYEFQLPKGALYFAIRHKSFEKFALLVDDVVYAPEGAEPDPVTLLGYNIYRDGVKINDAVVTSCAYRDATAVNGVDYVYGVSAVWDKGESSLSNLFSVKADSGIAAAVTANVEVIALKGAIRVNAPAATAVSIYTTSGVMVNSALVANSRDFSVAPGIYIVKAGNRAVKVSVR